MKSLQFNISIQQRPTQVISRSSEDHLLYSIWGIKEIWGVWTHMHQIKVRKSYIECHCRSLTHFLILNETSVSPFEGQLIIPVLVYLELGHVKEKPQVKGIDMQEFIQSVKFHILHQIKLYSRVKTNWELSDTCISISGELGQVRKIRPNCSK